MINKNIQIQSYKPGSFSVGWDWKGVGYGEISVNIIKNKNGETSVEVWNDNLSKSEVHEILTSYVEYIINRGEFKEFRED